MSIRLNDPIKLYLEEIDIDNHIPSVQFNLKVRNKQFFCSLEYEGQIWIKCDDWDSFVNSLNSPERISILKDINASFLLQITKNEEGAEFLWSISCQNIQNSMIAASSKITISNDVFSIIKEQFISYPKWW